MFHVVIMMIIKIINTDINETSSYFETRNEITKTIIITNDHIIFLIRNFLVKTYEIHLMVYVSNDSQLISYLGWEDFEKFQRIRE